MRTRNSSQSADANQTADSTNDWDMDGMDTMCLVYPDGSTRNVSTQQGQSKD